MNMRGSKGYTMLEIMLAGIIAGTITVIAIPKLNSVVEQARATEALEVMGIVWRAQMDYRRMTGEWAGGTTWGDPEATDDLAKLGLEGLTLKHYDGPYLVNNMEADGGAGDINGGYDVAIIYLIRKGSDNYRLKMRWDGVAVCDSGNAGLDPVTCCSLGFKEAINGAPLCDF